jgi:hypothetical protein
MQNFLRRYFQIALDPEASAPYIQKFISTFLFHYFYLAVIHFKSLLFMLVNYVYYYGITELYEFQLFVYVLLVQ